MYICADINSQMVYEKKDCRLTKKKECRDKKISPIRKISESSKANKKG